MCVWLALVVIVESEPASKRFIMIVGDLMQRLEVHIPPHGSVVLAWALHPSSLSGQHPLPADLQQRWDCPQSQPGRATK